MKVQCDTKVDALYIELWHLEPGTAEARDLTKDITADYGPDGKLAGVEILGDSKLLKQDELHCVILEVAPAMAA